MGESQREVDTPDALFAAWAVEIEAGRASEFEELLRAYAQHAQALRQLHADWEYFAPILAKAVPGSRLSGASVILPLLGDESGPAEQAPSRELIERLPIRVPHSERYRFRSVLGRGGGGIVVKVLDTKLNRLVAMKIAVGSHEIYPSDESPRVGSRALTRFVDEACIAGQLDHPGIAAVHELGGDDAGGAFFTMRLVRGETLAAAFEHVRLGRRGWNQTRGLGVLLRVCETMAYAHDKGVIHRDLKPSNVMLGPYGEVHVMDWGLARVVGVVSRGGGTVSTAQAPEPEVVSVRGFRRDETPASALLTKTGDAVGTPSFMAPEQALGQLAQIGPCADVYAVGAMLYQLIGGEAPFLRKDADLTPREVLEAVVAAPPRPLHELAPRSPVELVAICEKAMAREIAGRYPTMQALADDLRAYIEGRVVRAYETGMWAETRKLVQRNKGTAAALAAAVVTLAIGIPSFVAYVREAGRGKEEAMRNGAIAVAADIEKFLRDSGDGSFVEALEQPATDWWLSRAREIVEGSPRASGPESRRNLGLKEYERQLDELRRSSGVLIGSESEPNYPRSSREAEVRWRTDESLWRRRMRGMEDWPDKAAIEAQVEAEQLSTDCTVLGRAALDLVGLDRPKQFGSEVRALVIAERAVKLATTRTQRARCLEALAWSLCRVGEFDDALAQQLAAIDEARKGIEEEYAGLTGSEIAERQREDSYDVGRAAYWVRATTDNLELLKTEISCWRDEGDEFNAASDLELASLREAEARREWRFRRSEDQWWHDRLTALVSDMRNLDARLELARRATTTDAAREQWSRAIAAIANSSRYDGLRLTPQLDLLPLGEDGDSGLWEFAHLPTGLPARRVDGKLALTRNSGLVFVLLPKSSLHVAGSAAESRPWTAPFFLSKYEMTHEQWTRATRAWPPRRFEQFTLTPVTHIDWDECTTTLKQLGGWLGLPTETQWLFGCAAGQEQPWWLVDGLERLREYENLDFQSALQPSGQLGGDRRSYAAVGRRRANPYGLCDMLGNVSEWCSTVVTSQDESTATHVCMGGRYLEPPSDEPSRVERERWIRDASIGVRPARPLTR